MNGAHNETPNTRLRRLLAELISCPDYTGKLRFKMPQNIILQGAMSDYYRCSLPAEEGRESRIVGGETASEVWIPSSTTTCKLSSRLGGAHQGIQLIQSLY